LSLLDVASGIVNRAFLFHITSKHSIALMEIQQENPGNELRDRSGAMGVLTAQGGTLE
jgi:hypothetical protein